MSPMQCALALFLMATSSMIITDAARGLHQQKYHPATVDLGTAYNLTVLAYSTVTNTGNTTIGGLLGVSPGSQVSEEDPISYFDMPSSNGRASSNDAAAGKADAMTAYLDAKGRDENVVVINVVNIGGKTFVPGLYKTAGALEVSSGTMTLDAGGNSKGVFIFQIASTLQMSTGLKMVLANEAKAENVFWQLGSAATFEVDCQVVGNVMAYSAITVKAGCKVEGRLFAMNEAVVLDTNEVVFPSM